MTNQRVELVAAWGGEFAKLLNALLERFERDGHTVDNILTMAPVFTRGIDGESDLLYSALIVYWPSRASREAS